MILWLFCNEDNLMIKNLMIKKIFICILVKVTYSIVIFINIHSISKKRFQECLVLQERSYL